MLKLVGLALFFFGISIAEEESLEEIRDYINTYNWDVECWGEQNVLNQRLQEKRSSDYCSQLPTVPIITTQLQQGNSFTFLNTLQPVPLPTNYLPSILSPTLLRGKRQAYASNNNVQEFLEEVEEFAEEWDTKLSNLTCVLKTMGYINEDFTLNTAAFQSEFFSKIDITATDNLADPVWRQKTTSMMRDCLDTAATVPQTLIDNNPVTRRFGPLARCAVFVKCAKAATKKMCGAAQAEKLIKKIGGIDLNYVDASRYGIRDKYEQAIMAAMVLMESKEEEAQFIEEFFHGD